MIKQDYLLRMIQEIIALIVQALLNKRKIAKSSWTAYDNLTTQILGFPANELLAIHPQELIDRYQGDADSWGKCELAAMTLLKMSDEMMSATNELRSIMFERVYELANKSIQERSERMLTQMFAYFTANVDKLPKTYLRHLERDGKERVVCDYLSGMTDRYAISVFESLFIPSTFSLGGSNS